MKDAKEWSKEVLAKNLTYYMNLYGINQKELAEIVGVDPVSINHWVQAKKFPRIDRIELMSKYFGIQKSDLIEEHIIDWDSDRRARFEAYIGRDPELLQMIEKYIKLTDENKRAVKQIINSLSEKRPL